MNFLTEFYVKLFPKKREFKLIETAPEIDKLPQEILHKILAYLSVKDLVALTYTCRRFANLINTQEYLPKLTLRVTETTKTSNWIGSRKYEKLLIVSDANSQFFKLPKYVGWNVTILTIDCWDISMYKIRKIIKLCPNLKELTLAYLIRTQVPNEITENEEILLEKLDKFSLQGELDILRCFKKLQVKELMIHRQSDLNSNLDELAEFIINQTGLVNLELYHMYYVTSLFFREEVKRVLFRLEKVTIRYCAQYSYFCLVWFIASQKDSIKYISVDEFGFDMIKFLMSFTAARTLRLTLRENYPEDEENVGALIAHYKKTMFLPQFEELEIWNYCHNFIYHFPNVKILKINGRDVDLNTKRCLNLEILQVLTKKLQKPLKLNKNLKKLELIIKEYPKDQQPWDYNDCCLDHLTIIGAKDLAWLQIYLEDKSTKLKFLKIEKCNLTGECREVLTKFQDKIEKLKIIEHDGEEIDDLQNRFV